MNRLARITLLRGYLPEQGMVSDSDQADIGDGERQQVLFHGATVLLIPIRFHQPGRGMPGHPMQDMSDLVGEHVT